ncbi:MAG: dTDP-4-dehydrorhamnose reductase [Elusimicrobia bacterium RIFOXYB2_FULL_62_6]|nr:MAG: dTDP-4-dehydrorhamnose reductase [Elusimicrobia bacterium RIFOXYB2_FULL_62_6]
MNILVIGSGGQVGKAVCAAAAALGHRAFGADIKPAGQQFSIDLADPASVGQAVEASRPGLTVLCSAMTRVDGCELDPELARKLNAEAPGAVAELCAAAGSRLVYLSTEYVFDGKNGPYSETDPVNPISVYGRTKLEGEARVLARLKDALSVRTTVVYSYDLGGTNFIMQLLDRHARGEEMKVPRDQFSNPTYAPELADFILELALAGKSGVYNVVGADRMDRYEFALKACEAFGLKTDFLKPVTTAELKQAAPRPLNAGLKTGKLLAELGRAPAGPDEHFRTISRLLAGSGGARK